MIIKIGNYDVKIEAKVLGSAKFNKEDALYIIEDIAIAYSEASTWCGGQGMQVLCKIKDERCNTIRQSLKEAGFYKD